MEYHNGEKEDRYAYWLHNIPGIGNKKIASLLEYAGTPEGIYHMGQKELEKIVTSSQAEKVIIHRGCWDREAKYKKLLQKNIKFIYRGQSEYPEKLSVIPDAPFGLYVLGELPEKDRISVAVIGARICSEYGRYTAVQFGRRLTQAGIAVVSGMASGIDGISQRAALEAGGSSYAVLGCGADICYPKENSDIYAAMVKRGGIISEYPPGTEPRAQNFPPRNRIISGLADAVLVIEAKQKSGTLITVDMALEQGKEVYAVPGRITDALSYGCNRLLKQGAGMILSPEELAKELFAMRPDIYPPYLKNFTHTENRNQKTEEEDQLLAIMEDTLKPVSRIYEELLEAESKIHWTVPVLMKYLLQLQMSGYIRQEAGSYCIDRGQ